MENLEIKYLLAIAEQGNLTQAAKSLYISQPALSKYLKAREKELGAPLFVRQNQRMRPTELGRIVLGYARQIAALEQACNTSVQDYLRQTRQHIQLGIPSSRVEILTEVIQRLKENNPDFQIDILTDHSHVLLEKARRNQLDLAIVNRPVIGMDQPQNDHCLWREELVVKVPDVVARRFPLPDRRPLCEIELAWLEQETFYLSNDQNMLGRMAQLVFHTENFTPRRVVIMDNSLLAARMAEQENGVCFSVDQTVRPHPMRYFDGHDFYRLPRRYFNEVCLCPTSEKGRRLKLDGVFSG